VTPRQASTELHFAGAPGGNRTPDLDVRTVLLYPLSYGGGTALKSISALRAAPLSYGGRTALKSINALRAAHLSYGGGAV
jgi:hypothetical protein